MEFNAPRLRLWLSILDLPKWLVRGGVPLSTEWLTARELASLRLPGWPQTVRGVDMRMKRMGWRRARARGCLWRRRRASVANGGGIEYAVVRFPDREREAINSSLNAILSLPVADRFATGA
jgi:hypothetical protein